MSTGPRFHVSVHQTSPIDTPAMKGLTETPFFFVQAESVKDAYEMIENVGVILGITFKITKIEEAF